MIDRRGFRKGSVKIKATEGLFSRFFAACTYRGILLRDVEQTAEMAEFWVCREDLYRLKPLIHKYNLKIKIEERTGIPYMWRKVKKARWFLIGAVFCFLVLHFSSGYIWNIEISGNSYYTDSALLASFCHWNYTIGMNASDVKEEELELRIRKQFPKITWASVSKRGSVIYVRLKEEYLEEIETVPEEEWDLVAEKSGIVAGIVTRTGVPEIKIGDPVEVGQVLISGTVQKTDDFGTVIGTDYVKADGEIYLFRTIPYEHTSPLRYTVKETDRREVRYGIRCFGKYFPLYKKKQEQDVMVFEEEYYPKFYGSVVWPVSIHKVQRIHYTEAEKKRTKEEGIRLEEKYLDTYLCKMEKMGVQIIEKNVKIGVNENTSFAEGTISIIEKVGTRQRIEKAELTGEQTDQ